MPHPREAVMDAPLSSKVLGPTPLSPASWPLTAAEQFSHQTNKPSHGFDELDFDISSYAQPGGAHQMDPFDAVPLTDHLQMDSSDSFSFPPLDTSADMWSISTTSGSEEERVAYSWPSSSLSSPSTSLHQQLQTSSSSSEVPLSSFPSVPRVVTSASLESAYHEVVRRNHRLVDRRRRQREAVCIAHLATLASLPESQQPDRAVRRRPLDKIATLESVGRRLETLLHRVAELEEHQRSSATTDKPADANEAQQPVLAWPVEDVAGDLLPSPPHYTPKHSIVSNGNLVQGSIKALCVHAGTGRTVDCTSLAKLCMTGSIDCSLDQLSSPSWSACQRMLAPAAARGEVAPFFYYSADQSSPVDFIGTPEDPGLTRWLADLFQLLTHRKSSIEGTKLFKLSDGQWHASTSRLWLLDRDTRKVEPSNADEGEQGQRIEVDWDCVVVVLSLSTHRLPLTAKQSEQEDSLDNDQAGSEVAHWRQWSAFSSTT